MEHYLTNEKITKRFTSKFDLVNHAIQVAVNMIETGRDPRVKIDGQNRALQTIAEITEGKDYLEEVEVETETFSTAKPQVIKDVEEKGAAAQPVAL